MIVDANILLYAADETSFFHEQARTWLDDRLNGAARIGLPWLSLAAFQRIATRSRALTDPLTPERAWSTIEAWLGAPAAWVPVETERHREILGGLINRYHLMGNLVTDACLAALAIEHGVPVASADTDFARFRELEWVNPIAT